MKKSHMVDGVALTKFLFWLKKNFRKKKITEISAQKRLENFRKMNKDYKFPSFSTISGTGPNSAIIHYKASVKSNRTLKKGDLYLVDSGGQYSFGTTDVTRTISLDNNSKFIREIYTRVLKGHIAVSDYKIKKNSKGSDIDRNARKSLKEIRLDYPHGTGHGVGYFLNVHEGPQSFSKKNKVNLKPGMIISNEPGYYKEGYFGIRIENLIYIKKNKFEELTMTPMEKDLIKKKMLNKKEIAWVNKYNTKVKKNLFSIMNLEEKDNLIEGRFTLIRRSNDVSQSSKFVPSPQIGEHKDDKFGTHHARDAVMLFKTLNLDLNLFSSAMIVNSQYMHILHFHLKVKEPATIQNIIDNFESNDLIATTEKVNTNEVFSFGRDHGHFGRILNQTVVAIPSLNVRNGTEITGFCFTPQDGNSLLSSIAVTEWFLYPHSYEDKIQCLSPFFFDEV